MHSSYFIDELVRFGASRNEHSNGTLLEHLEGVYTLLKQWDNSEEVCLGGLFHSVYGTVYYKRNIVEITQRTYIRKLIGEGAEELAYLFCVSDRADFLHNFSNQGSYRLRDLFLDKEILITSKTFCALVEISFANILEQLPRIITTWDRAALNKIYEQWKPAKDFASNNAYQYFLDCFAFFDL